MLTGNKKGFSIRFENGVTVSVQWGAGNYCLNYKNNPEMEKTKDSITCDNAEIDIWDDKSENLTERYETESETWMTHVTPPEIVKVLTWAEKL